MDIYLHNTLGDAQEKFTPITPGQVSMYACGPTVYNYAHIGNFRTFIINDLLRRMFEYNSLRVNHVMNITDVDDKTIRRSQEEGVSLETVTRRYEDLFFTDLASLNILPPTHTPRATAHVREMIALIEKLIEKGIAYVSDDGVYFDITKSPGYGTLAKLDLAQATQERIANDEYDKENARDFALWKFYTESDGDVVYDAPFGKGRPGWHIECSAMCMHTLGEHIDIHTGGSDLIFPHHTNEIAQSEGVTGKKFANMWVHGGFITVDGKKMSKSLGNTFTLADISARGIDPLAFRYFVLGAHYSTLQNFTWEALEGAETAWKNLRRIMSKEIENDIETEDPNILTSNARIFNELVNNDLDMPKAIALVWQIIRNDRVSLRDKQTQILDFDRVLGLKLGEKEEGIEIPDEVSDLVTARNIARSEKNWKLSDELRDQIESLGFKVLDTDTGTEIIKK